MDGFDMEYNENKIIFECFATLGSKHHNFGWQSVITWGVFPKSILMLNCFGDLQPFSWLWETLIGSAQEGSS